MAALPCLIVAGITPALNLADLGGGVIAQPRVLISASR